jgi:hypothetical protein
VELKVGDLKLLLYLKKEGVFRQPKVFINNIFI